MKKVTEKILLFLGATLSAAVLAYMLHPDNVVTPLGGSVVTVLFIIGFTCGMTLLWKSID